MKITPYWWLVVIFLPEILAQVFVNPSDGFVSYPGGSARFFCSSISSQPIVNIQWLLNTSTLESLNLSNVIQGLARNDFNEILGGELRFANIPVEYNNTDIQCSVEYTTGSLEVSQRVKLLLQGTLTAVGSLSFTSEASVLHLSWIAPTSLNFSGGIMTNITYCVNVVNSTSFATLYSECGINVTEFTYHIPPDSDCHATDFTVIPVNVVGEGTSRTATYKGTEVRPEIVKAVWMDNVMLNMSAQVCDANLKAMDIYTGEVFTLKDSDLTITTTSIIFSSQQLKDNRRYNVTVTASNIAGSAASSTILSTHDISNVIFTEKDTSIAIETDYIEESRAQGALVIFVPLDDSDGVVFVALDNSEQTLPFSLSGGRMEVFVYDIESDGALASGVGYPAINREITINETAQGFEFEPIYSLLKKCDVFTSQGLIMVECEYSSDSPATGFQIIVRQEDPRDDNIMEMDRIYANKTTDRQTSASVAIEENGLYQVTVFGIKEEIGMVNSTVEFIQLVMLDDVSTATTNSEITVIASLVPNDHRVEIATGTVVGACIVLALIVIVILLLVIVSRKHRHLQESYRPDEGKYASENNWQSNEIPAESTDFKPPSHLDDIEPSPTYASVTEESPAMRTRNGRIQEANGEATGSPRVLRAQPAPAATLAALPQPDLILMYEMIDRQNNSAPESTDKNDSVDSPPTERVQPVAAELSIEEDPFYDVVDAKREAKKLSANKGSHAVLQDSHEQQMLATVESCNAGPSPFYAEVDLKSEPKRVAASNSSHITTQEASGQQTPETELDSQQEQAAAMGPQPDQSSASSNVHQPVDDVADSISKPVSSKEDIRHVYAMVDNKRSSPKKQRGGERATDNKNTLYTEPVISHLVATEESFATHPQPENSQVTQFTITQEDSRQTATYSVVDLSRKTSRRICRENVADSHDHELHTEQPLSSGTSAEAVSDESSEHSQMVESPEECASPVPVVQTSEDEESIDTSQLYAVVDKSKKTSQRRNNTNQSTPPVNPFTSAPSYHQEVADFPREVFASGVAVEESIHPLNARANQYDNVAPLELKEQNSGMGVFRIRGSTPPYHYPTTREQQLAMESQMQTHSFSTPVQEEQRRGIPRHQGVRGVLERDMITGYPEEDMPVTDV